MLVPKTDGFRLNRRPATLAGARLQGWRQRLLPAAGHDAWRGCRPWKLGALPYFGARDVWPVAVVRVADGRILMRSFVAARWLVSIPLSPAHSWGGVGAAGLARRLQGLWATVMRALGGLCRMKLRFKGKSFKWHRRRGALMLRFGHAHLVALRALPGVRWRRLGRMKIVLFGSDWWSLLAYAQAVCWWRPVNIYHGRGIRLRRQLVCRKAGKVSAYR